MQVKNPLSSDKKTLMFTNHSDEPAFGVVVVIVGSIIVEIGEVIS